ncbi:pilus assembly protein PilP [Vreelandella rituensis]|uniref:Pilus assembly protein PilP n=1 Tax=Vreelandella rituensis TaxID=2282306 RepID=A0A368U8J6_9GAMM|nr:pilus assembly protein PilP [Halomonas rituensis]
MGRLLFGVLLAVTGLSGCGDPQLGQLDQRMQEIRQMPGGPPRIVIPVVPEYQPLEYRHESLRSPFLPREAILSAANEPFDDRLAPNQQRPEEPLERYPLQELRLVGTLRMGNRHVALITAPGGEVFSLSEGNYLGTHHGRIKRIDTNAILIAERVFTERDGWREREVELMLETNAMNNNAEDDQ